MFSLLLVYLVWMLRTPNEDETLETPDLYALWLTVVGIVPAGSCSSF